MQINDTRAAVAAVWISAVGAAGLVAQVTAPSSWLVLGACAAFPPLVMMRLWRQPQPSMSESIQDVLR